MLLDASYFGPNAVLRTYDVVIRLGKLECTLHWVPGVREPHGFYYTEEIPGGKEKFDRNWGM